MKSLKHLNETVNTIEINGLKERLMFCFWTEKEIQDSKEIKAEWDVEENLIPFWGNWHYLFCFNQVTKEIIYLNDPRETLCTWESLEAFKKSLSYEEESDHNIDLGIIEEESFLDF